MNDPQNAFWEALGDGYKTWRNAFFCSSHAF